MHRLARSERGSIPVVLLTSIIVAGLVVVLVAATLVNQRTARFDRSFTTVLQESDEYVQRGAHHVIRRDWDPIGTDPVGQTYQIAGATTCPAVAHGDVCMTATKVSSLRWEVEATAAARTTGNDVTTRTVSVDLVDEPRFFLAAFADTSMTLRGANASSGYGNGAWDTGSGVVGSNGNITLLGASTDVDGVVLYDWANYANLNRCTHAGGPGCDDVKALPDAVPPSARVDERMVVGGQRLPMAFVDDTIAQCEADAAPGDLDSYTSSIDGSTLSSVTMPTCVDNLTLDSNVTVSPVSDPVEIYVRGRISIANGVDINCPPVVGCDPGNIASDPDSTRLRIYSAGGDVTLGNNADVAGAIYAPRSDCTGNPSNAQARLFGSLICDTIGNNGGWEFSFDDDLVNVGSGVYQMTDYREE